ncbi:hypothetical protein FRC20_006185 [Serendipita sp. 405]|nr:hypothetical protein FRC15_006822 [Serendipita sp. 397]KAG8816014.1 hypothetical protein FRC18_001209 [Serendipita sp. 400]KAG8839028.1 hypothetical protein FRC20_006185 [Serendipita sp. 405]
MGYITIHVNNRAGLKTTVRVSPEDTVQDLLRVIGAQLGLNWKAIQLHAGEFWYTSQSALLIKETNMSDNQCFDFLT